MFSIRGIFRAGTPLPCANPDILCRFCRGFFGNKPRRETIRPPDGVQTCPLPSPREKIRMMRTISPSRMLGPQPRVSLEPKPPSMINPRVRMTIVASWTLLTLHQLPLLIHSPRPQLNRLAQARSRANVSGLEPRLTGYLQRRIWT